MLRDRVEAAFRSSLYNSLVEREADLIEDELSQENAKEIFLNRAIHGIQGYNKMTADDMIGESSFCENWLGEEYIGVLAKHLIMDEYKEDLEMLIAVLQREGVTFPTVEETCPRKKALISYLKDIKEYEDVAEIKVGTKPNPYEVCLKNDEVIEYKVYTEQECINEMVEWYESDMEAMSFGIKEISEILNIPEEMVEVLGLLENTDYDSGDGTKFLYQTLKKAGKLEELASNAKRNNFGYLACEYNSAKVDDYYVLYNDYL